MASLRPEEAVKGKHIRVLSSFLRRFIHTHTLYLLSIHPAYLSACMCENCMEIHTYVHNVCAHTHIYA